MHIYTAFHDELRNIYTTFVMCCFFIQTFDIISTLEGTFDISASLNALWQNVCKWMKQLQGLFCRLTSAYLLIQPEQTDGGVGRSENHQAFIRSVSSVFFSGKQIQTHSRCSAQSPGEVLYVNQHGVLLHVELVSDQQQLDQLLVQTWAGQRKMLA